MPLKQWPVDIQHGVMIEVNLEQVNGILGGAGKNMEKPKCAWHQPRVDSHFEKTLFVFPRFYVFNVFLTFVWVHIPYP